MNEDMDPYIDYNIKELVEKLDGYPLIEDVFIEDVDKHLRGYIIGEKNYANSVGNNGYKLIHITTTEYFYALQLYDGNYDFKNSSNFYSYMYVLHFVPTNDGSDGKFYFKRINDVNKIIMFLEDKLGILLE